MADYSARVVIGLIGLSETDMAAGETGYCWFPIGPDASGARGGREWERVKVTAISNIRANYDVLVVDNKRHVKEYSMKVSELKEEVILNNADDIPGGATASTVAFQTTGFNKINGFIFADQNITVYVDQGRDGQNWDVTTDVFGGVYIASSTDGGFSVEVIAAYARVRFNNGTATQTTVCRKMVQLSTGA